MSHMNSALSLLQTAKPQLDLLMQMATAKCPAEALANIASAFANTLETAIKLLQTDEAGEASGDGWADYELEFPEAPVTEHVGKVWSVHDCHTYHKKGEWVATAIADGQYGIGVAPTFGSKDSANEKVMGPLGEVMVSKRRWAAAKNISVGDCLFMGDTHGKKVFKGLVTGQPVAGPFCPLASADNSFRIKFAPGRLNFDQEVEVSFNVSWTEVGSLTDEWKDYLGTKRLVTVSPLTTAPPA
jgi:hypothetical protein